MSGKVFIQEPQLLRRLSAFGWLPEGPGAGKFPDGYHAPPANVHGVSSPEPDRNIELGDRALFRGI